METEREGHREGHETETKCVRRDMFHDAVTDTVTSQSGGEYFRRQHTQSLSKAVSCASHDRENVLFLEPWLKFFNRPQGRLDQRLAFCQQGLIGGL